MAKIIIGSKNIGGILRVGEDVEIAEAVDSTTRIGDTVAYIRHLPEYSGEGDGGEFFEIEIPSWEYKNDWVMVVVKQKATS